MSRDFIALKKLLLIIVLIGIKQTNAQIITTVAGSGGYGGVGTGGFSGDGGPAVSAEFRETFGLAFSPAGNLYISDAVNQRIRMIDSAGIVTTVAGTGVFGYNGNGGQATNANLASPYGLTFDPAGNLYIADGYNNRIRKLDTSGILTTIAGTGTQGYSGDGGQATAAELYRPAGVAFDSSGTLYISDWFNNCIRKIEHSGIIRTVAGTGTSGYTGDGGTATAAKLYKPISIAFSSGNLFIADTYNHCIRKVNQAGIISTVAGVGTAGFSGDNGPATSAYLYYPADLTFDAAGNLYFSDEENSRIRMIDASGIITTVAGSGPGGAGSGGFSGDGGSALSAKFADPVGIVFDASGNLYVADELNNRVRKITYNVTTDVKKHTGTKDKLIVYPHLIDDEHIKIHLYGLNTSEQSTLVIYDIMGNLILKDDLPAKENLDITYNSASLSKGIYLVEVVNSKQKGVNRLIKQ
jgi:sugar lactone lactonase YvrE